MPRPRFCLALNTQLPGRMPWLRGLSRSLPRSLPSASPVSASPPHSEPEQKSPHPRHKKDGVGAGIKDATRLVDSDYRAHFPFSGGFPGATPLTATLAASAQGRDKRAVLHSEKGRPRDRDLISRSQRVDGERNRSYSHVTRPETRTILNPVARLDVG